MPDTVEALRDEVAALREEIDTLRSEIERVRHGLVPVAVLAQELDVHPRTVRRRCSSHGIPIRTMTGKVRPNGSQATPYVSRTEWETRSRLPQRTVNRKTRVNA